MRRPRFERTSVDSARLSVSQRTESIAFSAFRTGPAATRRGGSAPPAGPRPRQDDRSCPPKNEEVQAAKDGGSDRAIKNVEWPST